MILDDRPLDETHPLWPTSHYGAHKAAIEAFVHSYGLGQGWPICALRPTGIYGLAHPPATSKWFDLVGAGRPRRATSTCRRGGKEVHAADVARAVGRAPARPSRGDRRRGVQLLRPLHLRARGRHDRQGGPAAGARSTAAADPPKHQIVTAKLQALGMAFGGRPLLEATVAELIAAA